LAEAAVVKHYSRQRSLAVTVALIFATASSAITAPSAAAQKLTIPEGVARGAVGSTAGVPSGIAPSVESVLTSTDVMVAGTVSQPHSYLSDDQTQVFTDYRITEPVYYFQSQPTTSRTPGLPPDIVVTLLGGTIPVGGIMFTEVQRGLPPLTPASRVLLLLQHVDNKYSVAGPFLGAFRIENDRLIPLTGVQDFASEFTGRSASEAIRYMQARLSTRIAQ
jgi:hypothetical protein